MNFLDLVILAEEGLKLAPNSPLHSEIDDFEKEIKQQFDRLKEFDLQYDQRTNSIYLAFIQVHKDDRGTGVGSQVMQELCDFADARSMDIWLSLADSRDRGTFGTTSRARLIKFYKQFGFVENKGKRKDYKQSMYCNMYRRAQ